jgi:RNA polymerase sigma-70 factor (ECF subfamily)
MAWRLIGTREEAQDVAQDVCVKVASAVRSFRGNAEFSTWLYRVAYNTAIDHMRARERMRRGERPDVVVLFQGRTAESAETAMAGSELWNEVRRLPQQQRDAVILVYAEDLTHAEAAAVMGCTEKTVS